MKPAIFLDRDGVLNHNEVRNGRPYAPTRLADFIILPGVPEAVRAFREASYLVIVVTNQPDIATGKQSYPAVMAMHQLMQEQVPIDDIEICPHTDADGCDCRKPKAGMLFNAAKKHGIALDRSWMIGDRWRDVDAGRSAGCRTVFIDYHYTAEPRPNQPDVVVGSLLEAVPFVLRKP